MARRDLQDNTYRGIKADFDSKTSLYNIAVEHRDQETDPVRKKILEDEVEEMKEEVDQLQDAADESPG